VLLACWPLAAYRAEQNSLIMDGVKQRYLSAFQQVAVILLINTAGIWGAFFAITFLFKGIINGLEWPGILSFITNGSLLTITFSLLSTAIITTGEKLKLNVYNGIAGFFILVTGLLYIRGIALLNKQDADFIAQCLVVFIAATILLFFSLKDKNNLLRRNSWLKNTTLEDKYYDVFLSFAISGNDNDQASKDYVEQCIGALDETLRACGYKRIFSASAYFNKNHAKINPPEAASEDFMAIENSKNFLFFYPKAVPTSALMELGYAIRDKKNILIISTDANCLPFLAKGIGEIHENIRTLLMDDFSDILNNIKQHHKTYLKK
jgi:hypothetical protein